VSDPPGWSAVMPSPPPADVVAAVVAAVAVQPDALATAGYWCSRGLELQVLLDRRRPLDVRNRTNPLGWRFVRGCPVGERRHACFC
jgi:hypothetical protein